MGVFNTDSKKSLSDAPDGSVIIHTTNCSGVWESEVDAYLAKEFPKAFENYQEYCKSNMKEFLLGTSCISECNGKYIVSILASVGYGKNSDSTYYVLAKTIHGFGHGLYSVLHRYGKVPGDVYSVKLGEGDFKVPWAYTYTPMARLIMQTPGLNWHLCEGV